MKALLMGGPHDGSEVEVPTIVTTVMINAEGATAMTKESGTTLYMRSARDYQKFYYVPESSLWP